VEDLGRVGTIVWRCVDKSANDSFVRRQWPTTRLSRFDAAQRLNAVAVRR
jgi:hypothetical protein